MKATRHDLFRYSGQATMRASIRLFLTHPGYRFTYLKRTCERYGLLHPVGFVARVWYKRMQVKYGFQIPHTCKIGPGLFMGHYGNIVFNNKVVLGSNCNVAQGVTIGQVNRGPKTGVPTLGDRVWIGANAVIVGNITIGNDVLIAPLTYVNFDVPDKAVVLGNPGAIINYTGSGDYVNNVPL